MVIVDTHSSDLWSRELVGEGIERDASPLVADLSLSYLYF